MNLVVDTTQIQLFDLESGLAIREGDGPGGTATTRGDASPELEEVR